MAFTIISALGNSALSTIDSTSNALRGILYGYDGTEINKADRANAGITPGTTRGIPLIGVDHKTPSLVRASSDGSVMTGDRILLLYDRAEGATLNTNKWISSTTTMTITQSSNGILFNAGLSIAATVGAQILSHRFMPVISRSSLVFRCRALHSPHYSNNLIEMGFGSPASQTGASIANGACWRKDGAGQYVPVLSINGQEILGTSITNATFSAQVLQAPTSFALFEVHLCNNRAYYSIYKTSGELLFFQTLDMPTVSTGFQATRLQAMVRTYNIAATGTATTAYVTMLLDEVSVWMSDPQMTKPYAEQLSGNDQGLQNNPTTIAILDSFTNDVAPTTQTPTNTTANVNALGGQAMWNNGGTSFGASESLDLIIFSWQVPSPYGLMIKGIRLDSVSLGAASGTAAYAIEWFLAMNSSAVSLATAGTYPYRRKYLGFQSIAASAAIGTNFNPIDIRFQNGFYVYPSRFVAIGARVLGGSVATLSQVIRTDVSVDGYFE